MNFVECSYTTSPLRRNCRAHSHALWEITYNLEGEAACVIGGKCYNVTPGDIIVIPPAVSHDGRSEQGYTDVFIKANELDFSDVVFVHDFDGAVKHLFDMLMKLSAEKLTSAPLLKDALLESICQYVKYYSKKSNQHPAVIELKDVIYENLNYSDFRVSDAMRQMGFDTDYLRRLFKRQVGKTPSEYLTHLRLERAKSLLSNYNFQSVGSVAEECGFSDSYYFSTLFKKKVGLTPLQFRKQALS